MIPPDMHLVPIPVDEDIQNLSAILLDDDYYNFMLMQKIVLEELSVVNVQGLIPP